MVPAARRSMFLLILVVVAFVVLPLDAEAQERRRGARVAEIPVQVGIGPAAMFLGGPTYPEWGVGGQLMEDQLIHSGIRVSLTAVIDREVARRYPNLIPRNYRRQLERGEFRIAPAVVSLIPKTLIISPPVWGDAQAYGATWGVLGVGLPISPDPVRFSINASLIGTVMYIRSPSLQNQNYIFARPGAELRLDFEIPIETDFRLGFGFATQVYVPQTLQGTGSDSFGAGELLDERSLWNINQIYVQGHFRVPYSLKY